MLEEPLLDGELVDEDLLMPGGRTVLGGECGEGAVELGLAFVRENGERHVGCERGRGHDGGLLEDELGSKCARRPRRAISVTGGETFSNRAIEALLGNTKRLAPSASRVIENQLTLQIESVGFRSGVFSRGPSLGRRQEISTVLPEMTVPGRR